MRNRNDPPAIPRAGFALPAVSCTTPTWQRHRAPGVLNHAHTVLVSLCGVALAVCFPLSATKSLISRRVMGVDVASLDGQREKKGPGFLR